MNIEMDGDSVCVHMTWLWIEIDDDDESEWVKQNMNFWIKIKMNSSSAAVAAADYEMDHQIFFFGWTVWCVYETKQKMKWKFAFKLTFMWKLKKLKNWKTESTEFKLTNFFFVEKNPFL